MIIIKSCTFQSVPMVLVGRSDHVAAACTCLRHMHCVAGPWWLSISNIPIGGMCELRGRTRIYFGKYNCSLICHSGKDGRAAVAVLVNYPGFVTAGLACKLLTLYRYHVGFADR